MPSPLREFAVSVYSTTGVPDACLQLQDRRGVDVNLFLLAAFLGAAQGCATAETTLAEARRIIEPWHREVIVALRTVRRRLKSGPYPAPSPASGLLRKQVADAELEAEFIELDCLSLLCEAPTQELGFDERRRFATSAMRSLLDEIAQPLDPADSRAISAIAESSSLVAIQMAKAQQVSERK
ncbi:MAG: TIGR02444 family protein [Mycobacterium sp.]